ncbi:folylpolyglutamate synthase, mitochondrial-like isoform X3 [Zootermopsis nevadensis]|uniref:folylpolyglutamate synthase, mitochondrial-like isoform X3 n=1 Tax=Zootermopsis nevadensis TaxID=136037 RepID=UPI000B8E837B|nr:folylpolyglutamate synthase, mitochondrial-like isoform X3 [Zootermopsis nevadensis]
MFSHNLAMGYKEAVKALNSLQTNTAFIKELEKKDRHSHDSEIKKFEETIKFLERSGVSLEKLDELSVIHVSGTKGKGSTCAFCESILHHHGYKTGFYSSPHLVAVRERIRINGQPLSQSDFAKYFWNIYNSLLELRKSNNDMPSYFKFLTVMAFYVFLSEKVDVAIVEVGIGGEYDCTNILRQVSTVGITSLGIDHTNVLGNTIEEIAWQKAGIMKPGSITFTVDEQPKAALKVLKQRASEKKSTLLIAPPLASYDWSSFKSEFGMVANVQFVNASLAIQLANAWICQHTTGIHQLAGAALTTKDGTGSEEWLPVSPTFPISSSMALGLKFCTWPGRNQIINDGLIHFFLDGAHTSESLWLCADWFIQNSQAIAKQDIPYRVLVFNCTGNRDPRALLLPLLNCGFQLVIFCPNSVTTSVDSSSDQANYMTSVTQQLEKCRSTQDVWHELQEENVKNRSSAFNGLQPLYVPNNLPINFHDSCNSFKSKAEVKLFPCMSDTLAYLKKKTEDEACKSHILVTGSLHLVGTASSVLDPDLTLATPQLSGGIGISPFSSTDVMGSCTS